jgi:hypothetical protein
MAGAGQLAVLGSGVLCPLKMGLDDAPGSLVELSERRPSGFPVTFPSSK